MRARPYVAEFAKGHGDLKDSEEDIFDDVSTSAQSLLRACSKLIRRTATEKHVWD